ncbi:DNA cytosine methyltransferase [Sutterella sp.]|uniref:DNA cytosine methyltransferase n=1 Tax=Sutterella sp. TaxID=1981025 RepID=UPI0026DF2FAA|nr:DNA cytosine methyltransferase [Sutterella sp.]MDO5532264.1 DNA cytosine methyltransferase [Sutterella sp.]
MKKLKSLELCAGAGGQALGLEEAGFDHVCLVEIDKDACATLRLNRPAWNVREDDLHEFSATKYRGVDLVAGGVPCPPFSKAGKQLGAEDERNLFDEALRIVQEAAPRAVMLENVRGLLDPVFDDYRQSILKRLDKLGYTGEWKLINANDYGVPQLRPRAILVALRKDLWPRFAWPSASPKPAPTVGEALKDLMEENGWNADAWAQRANTIAPTLVGGSKKHGGPDLGPTRARAAWAKLDVEGTTIANEAPAADFTGRPRLTVRMTARLQGFPDSWKLWGAKTTSYRQVGNAFPPPVARAVGLKIKEALNG